MGKDSYHLPFHHLPTVSRCSQKTLLPPTTLAFQGQGSKSTWASPKTQGRFQPRGPSPLASRSSLQLSLQ